MKKAIIVLIITAIGVGVYKAGPYLYELGAGMCILYGIEALFVLGFVALIIGVAYKIVFYPMKTVSYINEYGNPRTKRVPDTDYHYKPEELWEPPTHWKAALEQAEKDWAKPDEQPGI